MAKEKKITYRIVLTIDGKQKKNLFTTKNRITCFEEFKKLNDISRRVMFPKEFNNNFGINPCKYQILLLKKLGVDAIKENSEIFGDDWKVVIKEDYNIEETFMMYGYDSRYERKNIVDLIKIILKCNKIVTDIIVVNNKIMIYNSDYFNLVVCKCGSDARRLNNILYQLFSTVKGTKLLFLGVANLEHTTYLYDIIEEETGWGRGRIRRTSTRP